ncbi:MarR family transcriptional regulator [Nocardioides sp. YIM 123512]|uniref:MarR family transcriptional regulator n=2 Tax=Nocardioides flavescens TaxID=2691959 RepID=A0A6L7ETI5_9ACTN|nr:MarR family transcriptional regulator [Nocardioides flavescens]MXG88926.1 MarR family transcriptional regulator [Nocardioides flavescens]
MLCFDLYSLSRTITGLYRPVLEPHGLTYPQYLVLVVLARQGRSTIGEIGRTTRLDHGTLTPLLRRMADRGLLTLERNPVDRRSVVVDLATQGEALRPVLHDAQCRIADALGMTEDELRTLQGSLQRLADHLDEVPAQ